MNSSQRFTPLKSTADYAAIAVAPLLIFLMISSLANFLMLILYKGGFPQRISWTLLFFTLGAVGIARVAIEQDRTYSFGYAALLGLASFVAMSRFADSPLFSIFMLCVIAYLADVIVRDCTLIDDSVDASGQGLVDSGRLYLKQQIQEPGEEGVEAVVASAHQPGRTVMYFAFAALPLFGLGQFFLRNDADTWSRAQMLLALYLFSSLSLLVSTSFLGLRRYLRQRDVEMPKDVSIAWLAGGLAIVAAVLMVAWLAPLPGKALATFELPAFLDSPGTTMASRFGWGDEAADKSSPDAPSTQADPNANKKETQSTTYKPGAEAGDVGDGNRKDGPKGKQQQKGGKKSGDSQSGGQQGGQEKQGGKEQSKGGGQEQKSGQQQGASEQSQQGSKSDQQSSQEQATKSQQGKTQDKSSSDSGQQSESSTKQGDSPSSSSKGDSRQPKSDSNEPKSDSNEPKSDSKQQNGDQAAENTESQEGSSESSDQEQSPGEDSAERRDSPKEGSTEDSAEQSQQQQGALPSEGQSGESEASGPSSMESIANALPGLGSLLKFLIFLALLGIVGGFLWLNRHLISEWWDRLFGGSDESSDLSIEELLESHSSAPSRTFASFGNPIGKESDVRRIVVITFQAFEAWTREQGSPRDKDETPSEFARRVAKSVPELNRPAQQVVDAYNRIVYGRGNASESDVAAAKKVWQVMIAG
ncbi:MAG: DUF4129 domain-containing protein [Rubripirellula sp.]